MRRSAALALLFLLLGLVAVACGSGDDGPGEAALEDGESEEPVETFDGVPDEQVSASDSSSWAEDDYRSAYFQLFGGEAVVEAHAPNALGEIEIPEMQGGLVHTLTEIEVDRVAYLREMEEDGIVEVPAIPQGTFTVFEVHLGGPPGEDDTVFFGLSDEPFLVVLDYGWGNPQADATGGWHPPIVATRDEAGDLSFHGGRGSVAAAFFAEAREQFVPSRYESDEALLVAIVSEAAESFLAGVPGELGTAVIESLG